jgi:propanol-preferring alcohol dehydrogenase
VTNLVLRAVFDKTSYMRVMLLERTGEPLREVEWPAPVAGRNQVLIRVAACALCRTDLHIVDGELAQPKLPLVLGHEIVGQVVQLGAGANRLRIGDRVGVPWLGWTCGACSYCAAGHENLCEQAKFTGYTIDGGYAEYTVADERFCFSIPESFDDAEAAPLLCAGLIGYRSLVKAGNATRIGVYGFGAAAHIVAQVLKYQHRELYAFTRPEDEEAKQFATEMGAVWAGGSDETPPQKLDAAIIFAPVGALIPQALKAVRQGGTVVCGGIHMSDVPPFPYSILWQERTITSVANLTRRDGEEFMGLASKIPMRTKVQVFPLEEANRALHCLRTGSIRGAAVLRLRNS